MALWILSILLFLVSSRELLRDSSGSGVWSRWEQARRELRGLRQVEVLLLELEETLEAGIVPEPDRWERLRSLPAPWGRLTGASLEELRRQGAAVLPTLRRLRELARDQIRSSQDARARSAQALAQAAVCTLLVPLFGASLHLLLPGVSEQSIPWLIGCGLALLVSGSGAIWMLSIAERARWGGLEPELRPWMLGALCAGERFLALVRSGQPADLAWVCSCEFLSQEVEGLASRWGHSVWEESPGARSLAPESTARLLVEAGTSIRRAVQLSLMEGKPCGERVETALRALREDVRARVALEVEKVATRALKPLFVCVAPSLLGLLGWGLFLSWGSYGLG